jgi:pimeloyl-ACP methyl ester carboxylesterase
MLETLSCPVHILHGSENRTIPLDKVRTLAEGNPRIILDAIAGAGHTLAMDRPELSLRRAFAQTLEFRSTT